MQGEPGGAELLRAAREALADEVLPVLTGNHRFTALMIANALGMVERELAAQERLRATDRAVASFGRGDADGGEASLRALCAAIRDGRHDGDEALHAALLARSVAAVAVTRPGALSADERQVLERET